MFSYQYDLVEFGELPVNSSALQRLIQEEGGITAAVSFVTGTPADVTAVFAQQLDAPQVILLNAIVANYSTGETPSENIASGVGSLQNLTSGKCNVALGDNALAALAGGGLNTAVGAAAGSMAIGSRNTFIGAGADIDLLQSTFGTAITTAASDQTVLANPTVSATSTYMVANRIFQSVTYPTAATLLPLDTSIVLASCSLPSSNNLLIWSVQLATTAIFIGGAASALETFFVQAINDEGNLRVTSKSSTAGMLKTTGKFSVSTACTRSGTTVALLMYATCSAVDAIVQAMVQITDMTPGVSRRPIFAN